MMFRGDLRVLQTYTCSLGIGFGNEQQVIQSSVHLQTGYITPALCAVQGKQILNGQAGTHSGS